MNNIPSKNLGVFFVVYQSQGNGYIKLWIDGNEDYSYTTREDFINMVNKSQSREEVLHRIVDSFDTYSYYLWDLDNQEVRLLKSDTDFTSYMKDISQYKLDIDKRYSKPHLKNYNPTDGIIRVGF